jgi:hypothetical protein
MARIKNGIMGPFRGTIANVVGYERLGTACMRKKADLTGRVFSEKQLAHQQRVRLANSFINPSKNFINIGFSLSTKGGQTAHNVAMSRLMQSGLKGVFPDVELDFENLLVADGDLEKARNPKVEFIGTALKFTWDYDNMQEFRYRNDQVMLLAFSPESGQSFYILGGARRCRGMEMLEVYPELDQQSFETYIAFITDDRKQISRSTYTRSVTTKGRKAVVISAC